MTPKASTRVRAAANLSGTTDVDAPYEPPENPDLILDTTSASIDDLAGRVIDLLNQRSPRQPAT